LFKNKKLLVTGGTGSIGNSICHHFNNNNCSEIYATTTNLNKINPKDSFIKYKQLNLQNIKNSNLDEIFNFDIDFLILNAGLTKDNIFLRMSADEWGDVIDVNLNSSFYILKHTIKKMIKQRFGRIVFISSVVAHTGNPGQVNYTASKSALSGMAKSLSLEVSTRNITVNCIAPGFIRSNMTDKLKDNQKQTILDQIPMKKMGEPADIAKVVGFLCSDGANYITGQTIHVNGGLAQY
jgi:3-oxoacyl-[acyl-carrier protein] reductase